MKGGAVPQPMRGRAIGTLSPSEFEHFVSETCGQIASTAEKVLVTPHEEIVAADGTYDIDVTLRFRFGGMDFLVLVEAKHHANPIKRELVQILDQKVRSAAAHKGVMMSTAPYQSGALAYARAHGLGLVLVTDGGLQWEARSIFHMDPMSIDQPGSGRPVGQWWRATANHTFECTVVTGEPDHAWRLFHGAT